MKKEKTLLSVLVVIMLLCSVVACSSTDNNGEEATASETEKIEWRMCVGTDPENPMTWYAQDISKRIEEKTEGRIKVEVYDSMKLGHERETLEQMQSHAVQLGLHSAASMSSFWEGWGMYSLPYLFDAREASVAFQQTEAAKNLNQLFEENTGIKVLGIHPEAFINILNTKISINTVNDLKDLKIRCMESAILVEGLNAIGAVATPINWAEAITAVQTGVVDGMSQTVIAMQSAKLYELMDNFAFTNTFFDCCFVTMDCEAWNSISVEDQKLVLEAISEAQEKDLEVLVAQEQEAIEYLTEQGVNFTYPDIEPFKVMVAPVYEKFYNDHPELEPIIEYIIEN